MTNTNQLPEEGVQKPKTTEGTDENKSLSWDLKGFPCVETSNPGRLSIDLNNPGSFCIEQMSVILNRAYKK